MRHTFDKKLGMPNPQRIEPVVEAGGKAWMTSKEDPNLILIVPDAWERHDNTEALPAGVAAITMDGERLTT